MPSNQRRYAQAIPLLYILIMVATVVCVATFGVKFLLLKQQLKQDGGRLSEYRKEIETLNTNIVALRTKKDRLTEVKVLKKAIDDNVIKLKPIDKPSVVEVPSARRAVAVAIPQAGAEEGR